MCLLILALYGHPESGALWDAVLEKVLVKRGWHTIDEWPGIWFHNDGSTLVVYVDDLMLCAVPPMQQLQLELAAGVQAACGGRHSTAMSRKSWALSQNDSAPSGLAATASRARRRDSSTWRRSPTGCRCTFFCTALEARGSRI